MMKCTIPEISWHNRDPVLSVDIQSRNKNENFDRLATGGTDSHVVIWHVELQDTGLVKVEFVADLQRHQRAVNVVRFSPSGELLASGDDESVIIIWKQKTDQDSPEFPFGDNENMTKEQWMGIRVLRGHMEDVYDLSWSPDSSNLISGSVDNSAILWDVQKGRSVSILKDHKGFVQGVAWDPSNKYIATMSSDRTCRVYNINSKKLVSRVSKALLPVPESSDLHGKVLRIFHDDTLKSFFRRLCFSPDGQLLIVPSGIIENPSSDKNSNATFIFTRHVLNRPSVYLPTNNQYAVAVRCCPLLFQLRDRDSVFALPYRIVIAVATQNSVLLYDTQQSEPFGVVSNMHYTRLTDLTWSQNGRLLIVSSTDGYCSIITFSVGELGEVYEPKKETTAEETNFSMKQTSDNTSTAESNQQSPYEIIKSGTASVKPRMFNTPEEENPTGTSSSTKSKNISSSSENISQNGSTKREYKSSQERVPRRIKPILLSSPKKPQSSVQIYSKVESEIKVPTVIPNNLSKCPRTTEAKVHEETCDTTQLKIVDSTTNLAQTCKIDVSKTVNNFSYTNSNKINFGEEYQNNISKDCTTLKKNSTISGNEKRLLDNAVSNGNISKKSPRPGEKILDMTPAISKLNELEPMETENLEASSNTTPPVSPLTSNKIQEKRTPRRVQLITLSSVKSKKKE